MLAARRLAASLLGELALDVAVAARALASRKLRHVDVRDWPRASRAIADAGAAIRGAQSSASEESAVDLAESDG